MYTVEIEEKAEEDIRFLIQSKGENTARKIEKLLNELREHPEKGTGHPEKLRGNLTGYWSRKINEKDRLIYRIEKEKIIVIVVSASGHYGDK